MRRRRILVPHLGEIHSLLVLGDGVSDQSVLGSEAADVSSGHGGENEGDDYGSETDPDEDHCWLVKSGLAGCF